MWSEHGFNWNDVSTHKKRGYCVYDNQIDYAPPNFTQDHEYIERWLVTENE
jgi:hypothetical protein